MLNFCMLDPLEAALQRSSSSSKGGERAQVQPQLQMQLQWARSELVSVWPLAFGDGRAFGQRLCVAACFLLGPARGRVALLGLGREGAKEWPSIKCAFVCCCSLCAFVCVSFCARLSSRAHRAETVCGKCTARSVHASACLFNTRRRRRAPLGAKELTWLGKQRQTQRDAFREGALLLAPSQNRRKPCPNSKGREKSTPGSSFFRSP